MKRISCEFNSSRYDYTFMQQDKQLFDRFLEAHAYMHASKGECNEQWV
jgi:hypothetical protein